MKTTIFVYGTLMRDGCRGSVLEGEEFLREARTASAYVLLDLRYCPGLVPASKRDAPVAVEGELWRVGPDMIERLDRIEGAPHHYQLKRINIEGETEPVYAYFYNHARQGVPVYQGARWDNSRTFATKGA